MRRQYHWKLSVRRNEATAQRGYGGIRTAMV